KTEVAPGVIELRRLGELDELRFLEGHTQDGSVGSGPEVDPKSPSTRWRVSWPSVVIGNQVPTQDDVLAVHAALFPTSEIVYFGGDEHDRGEHDRSEIDHTRLFS